MRGQARSRLRAQARALFYEHIELFETFVELRCPEMWERMRSAAQGTLGGHALELPREMIRSAWRDYFALLNIRVPSTHELYTLSLRWLHHGKARRARHRELRRNDLVSSSTGR